MKISELYKIFLKFKSISTDSRSIKKNEIFWALKGDNFNGNKFAEKALENGAAVAIVDEDINIKSGKIIYVNNTLKSLQNLANFHRIKLGLSIIAITGTNGKTTTKELIASVLTKKYKIISTKGNLNNHIGVPLTILSFNKDTEIGIVEMGANHPGEIFELCKITDPNFGLITNIGKAHLEGFKSFEGLKSTKAELYNFLSDSGTIFINQDNEILKSIVKNNKKVSYGTTEDVYCKGKLISSEPYVKLKLELKNKITIHSKLIGNYNFENILAAACIGKFFGISDNLIKDALEEYSPDNNRSQIIKKGNSTIISDAYNANPSSMISAILNFKDIEADKKVLILGDMFELGEYSEKEHSDICRILSNFQKEQPNTKIFLVGEEFLKVNKSIFPNSFFMTFKKTGELRENLANFKFVNTWILIKGSRGMKMETVIDNIKAS